MNLTLKQLISSLMQERKNPILYAKPFTDLIEHRDVISIIMKRARDHPLVKLSPSL